MAATHTLEELRKAAGLSDLRLANLADVDVKLIREAEKFKGVPVARAQIAKVLKALSDFHENPITIEDVKGLKVL
jgi:predicted transcriptional regulator